MADEEFEIDIYGDAPLENQDGHNEAYEGDQHHQYQHHQDHQQQHRQHEHRNRHTANNEERERREDSEQYDDQPASAPQQGTKRKGDDRVVDPGATNAITISDLNWWNTDDEIRGWARQAHCEDELRDITFSEHKVNGKSKGQVYLEFASQQAATATKHLVDTLEGNTPGQKRYNIAYSNPNLNPFRTLPKDTSNRQGKDGPGPRTAGAYNNDNGSNMGGGFRGNFRGRGGGFVPRGGMNQNNYNRNFAGGGMGGYNNSNNNMGGFNNGGMVAGGFNNNMGGFNRGGFGGGGGGGMRGGPVGMRGGRGGGMNQMGGIPMGPMGGMPMGGMGNPMGMMGGGMQGFQGMPQQFNPGFFSGGGGGGHGGGGSHGGGDWGNPHGAKRPRPE